MEIKENKITKIKGILILNSDKISKKTRRIVKYIVIKMHIIFFLNLIIKVRQFDTDITVQIQNFQINYIFNIKMI